MTQEQIIKALTGEPVADTPTITVASDADAQRVIDEHNRLKDPRVWAWEMAKIVCQEPEDGKTLRRMET